VAGLKYDACVRRKMVIDGEHFYLVVGKTFIQCVVPRENSPEQSKLRDTIETMCTHVTELLQKAEQEAL